MLKLATQILIPKTPNIKICKTLLKSSLLFRIVILVCYTHEKKKLGCFGSRAEGKVSSKEKWGVNAGQGEDLNIEETCVYTN